MSEYDVQGRRFALRKFGKDGLKLRRALPQLAYGVHRTYVEAQLVVARSGIMEAPSTRAYGASSWDLFEVVAQHVPGEVEGARAFRPPGSPYRVLMVHDVLVYPLRCSKRASDGYRLGRLTPQRERLLAGKVRDEPGLFAAPAVSSADDELAEEEREIVRTFQLVASQSAGVVAMVVGSSFHGMSFLEWGEAALLDRGVLAFPGFHEDLMWGINGSGNGGFGFERAVDGPFDGPFPSPRRPGPSVGGFASGDPVDPLLHPRLPQAEPPASGDTAEDGDPDFEEKDGSGD